MILCFRMELLLPQKWFKTIHSIGDNFLQLLLTSVFGNRETKTEEKRSLSHPYDASHKQRDLMEYAKTLEKLTRRDLIEMLVCYREEK